MITKKIRPTETSTIPKKRSMIQQEMSMIRQMIRILNLPRQLKIKPMGQAVKVMTTKSLKLTFLLIYKRKIQIKISLVVVKIQRLTK